jgi:hypothetical protein
MEINLIDKQCVDLDGNAVPGGQMSRVVSEMLATIQKTGDDPLKLWELAKKVKRGECDLDTADLDLVEKVVRAHEQWYPLMKGQILGEIGEQRRAKKDK